VPALRLAPVIRRRRTAPRETLRTPVPADD
jgi:hypothetical protein